jgi:hypothetical protein
MKFTRKLKFNEKASMLGLDAALIDVDLRDNRNGLQLGTLKQTCSQFGITISINGTTALLSAPRDRLQPIAERLHYCQVPFVIL